MASAHPSERSSVVPHPRRSRATSCRRALLALVLIVSVAVVPVVAVGEPAPQPETAVLVDDLPSSQSVQALDLAKELRKVSVGPTGARVTLDDGHEIVVDFGDLVRQSPVRSASGVNYVGVAAMLVVASLGLSLLTALVRLATGINRAFGGRRRGSHAGLAFALTMMLLGTGILLLAR